MKNKYDYKNIRLLRQGCNEWCCPCNEGDGCHANEVCNTACENSFFHEFSKWDALMNEAYYAMHTAAYDEICRKIYEYAEEN